MASLRQTEAAQERAVRLLGDKPQVAGIGITRVGDGYGLRVNLETDDIKKSDVPDQIDGVPVVVRVVGRIRALDSDSSERASGLKRVFQAILPDKRS